MEIVSCSPNLVNKVISEVVVQSILLLLSRLLFGHFGTVENITTK